MRKKKRPANKEIAALNAMFSEQMRWSALEMSLKELSRATPELALELEKFNPESSAALVAGLLAEPEYQSTTLRLELLVAFILSFARGNTEPSIDDVARWFSVIGESQASAGEDPAEDVFVTLVTTPREDFRVLEGLWESAGFYTQVVLDIVEAMPDKSMYRTLRSEVRALLVASEIVCEKSGLKRYETGSEEIHDQIDRSTLISAPELQRRVTISLEELQSRNVFPDQLEKFLLPYTQYASLLDQEPGLSDLDSRPFIRAGENIVVALPTAISIALRNHVINFVIATRQADNFDKGLANIFGLKIADSDLFGSESNCIITWRDTWKDRIASAALEFDKGYFIALHFILPSIRAHASGGFKRVVDAPSTLTTALNKAVRSITAQAEARQDFREGMHVVVLCGWGKVVSIPGITSKWNSEAISIADFMRLGEIKSMSAKKFWRLEKALQDLDSTGVEIINVNGVLNLLGWVEVNDGHLVPHAEIGDGRVSLERPLLIHPPLNLLRDMRADADRAGDIHVGFDVNGVAHRLRRVRPDPFFSNPSEKRVYACLDCIARKMLLAVAEGKVKIWLRIETPNLVSSDLKYRLWEMLCLWIGRVVSVLDEDSTEPANLELIFRFNDKQRDVDRLDATPIDAPETLIHKEAVGEQILRFSIDEGFIHAFRLPTNVAERAIVEAVLSAVGELQNRGEQDALVKRLTSLVMPNDLGRQFHVMHASDFTDYIREHLPSALLGIDDIDSARLRLGLGWSIHDGSNSIEGTEDCRKLLNGLVDERVKHVLSLLGGLDRVSLIRMLLLNHAAGHATEMHWKRTSAAVLGLYGDTLTTRQAVVEQLSLAAASQISSRILIEMAVSAAPLTGGRHPAELEVEFLFAEVALLIRLGGLSDGIYYGALEPRLRISPLGDVLLKDDLRTDVVEPMLITEMGEQYARSAQGYRRYYAEPSVSESTQHLIEREFVGAWTAEMGFEIDEGRRIVDLLEHTAIRREVAILELHRKQLVDLLSEIVSTTKVAQFLEHFSLIPREKWDVAPDGFKAREILPWRFGRRLSAVSRPLIQVDSSNDPLFLVSPSLVRSGFFNILRGAHDGTLDQDFFSSPEMRDAWWGKANEGHSFNALVATRLRNAGWNARENIELPAILQKKLERNFGDIDVIAWHDNSDHVLVIECKDLSLRRNYSEIAALLSDYRGEQKNGKPDKLLRHLNRVERIKQDLSAVSRYTSLSSPQIKSCLIVGGTVPMQFANISALRDTFVGEVEQLLSKFAI